MRSSDNDRVSALIRKSTSRPYTANSAREDAVIPIARGLTGKSPLTMSMSGEFEEAANSTTISYICEAQSAPRGAQLEQGALRGS